jgi:two-component system sensor histidine kinase DegS
MSNRMVISEDFLAQATALLHKIEDDLAQLAQEALSGQKSTVVDHENGRSNQVSEYNLKRQQLSQQLLRLSERSKFLQTCLQNDLDLSQITDNYWPQIRILQSQEEERAQLARELEDGVGQLLANAIFELASCRHLLASDQEAVSVGLDALQTELEQGLTDIRHTITNLEPSTILSNFGLGGGIRRYLEQYQTTTGLETQLRMQANIGRLPSIIETAIFRVIQEALANVDHHAKATRVDVIVAEDDGALQFSVIDNGDGLIADKIGAAKRNLGLARMVDYAELLNGELKILSEPGQGTQVILRIPYPNL